MQQQRQGRKTKRIPKEKDGQSIVLSLNKQKLTVNTFYSACAGLYEPMHNIEILYCNDIKGNHTTNMFKTRCKNTRNKILN